MRADKFFAEKFGSRTKAQAALQDGLVLRGGKPLACDDEIREGDEFTFLGEEKFVSRGGAKLERGLERFGADVRGVTAADLGTSTGGFCDCLLQRGAGKVYCVDVGRSQLDKKLEGDPRIAVMDGVNARFLKREDFPEPIDVVTADLSFISLRLVLPAVFDILQSGGRAFVLFKPQFECGGKGIGKSGIVPPARHEALLEAFYRFASALGLAPTDITPAPVRSGKNIEYMVQLVRGGTPLLCKDFLSRAKIFSI